MVGRQVGLISTSVKTRNPDAQAGLIIPTLLIGVPFRSPERHQAETLREKCSSAETLPSSSKPLENGLFMAHEIG